MRRLPCVLAMLALACASDNAPSAGEEGGTEASSSTEGPDDEEPPEDDGDPSTSGQMTTSGSDGSTTDPIPPGEPVPARGIGLTAVYANQGVELPLVLNGEYVDPSARNATMIKGRNALLRALWVLDDGFTPREIEAVVTLTMPDGSEEVANKTFMVAGDSLDSDLDTNIWFVLPGELIQPGVDFQLELFETGPGGEDEAESPWTAYPAEPAPFGVLETEMVLKTLIVPVHHNLGAACALPPTFDEQTLQPFIDQLYMQNPVESVEIEVRDAVEYTGSLNGSFSSLLSFMADLRGQDGADPAVYYYGVVRPCDGGPDGIGGQAISIPGFPSQDNGWARTSVGRWSTSSLISTVHTFVHEVGHTQGRRHVACSGQEGGANPSYPYSGGDIGVWGFGVVDFSLYSPENSKDYMTYCGNTWISDWGWENVVPYVQEITSWDVMDAAPAPERELLVGVIDPASGDESWFVTRGSATGRVLTGGETMTVTASDGVEYDLPATIGPMGEGDGYTIAVELPDDVPFASTARVARGNGTAVERVRYAGELVQLSR